MTGVSKVNAHTLFLALNKQTNELFFSQKGQPCDRAEQVGTVLRYHVLLAQQQWYRTVP